MSEPTPITDKHYCILKGSIGFDAFLRKDICNRLERSRRHNIRRAWRLRQALRISNKSADDQMWQKRELLKEVSFQKQRVKERDERLDRYRSGYTQPREFNPDNIITACVRLDKDLMNSPHGEEIFNEAIHQLRGSVIKELRK